MRKIWSEDTKRKIWRQIWLSLARTQSTYGLVTKEQIEDLERQVENIDIPRALEIEQEIQHDLVAELRTYAEKAPLGSDILHLGATSMDIEDNADILRQQQALRIILERLKILLNLFAEKIEAYAGLTIIAFTHLQPAEPTTLGYRLSLYAQDLMEDFSNLSLLNTSLKGKGFKGAVGTAASYCDLIGENNFLAFETTLSHDLGIPFFQITNQTYPRKQDFTLLTALASLSISLSKFAFDLRVLQNPFMGELSEGFSVKQVGSSAMPFKRNPIHAEKINSLARYLSSLPSIAWNNAALSLLERTLDDSANRRIILPEAFLATDEILLTSIKITRNLQVNEAAIQHNLISVAAISSTEKLMLLAVQRGANRLEVHERLRSYTTKNRLETETFHQVILQDEYLKQYLFQEDLQESMKIESHTGIATKRALEFARLIKSMVNS